MRHSVHARARFPGQIPGLLLGLCLGLFLSGLHPADAQQSPAGETPDRIVRIGVLAFGGEAHARTRWGATADALSTRIPGHRFDLVPLTLDSAEAALEAREIEYLVTNPGHYQTLLLPFRLAHIASLETDGPGPARTGNRYGAVILARQEADGPKRLADLRGKRFGAVAPDAFGGWNLALHTLRRQGLDPETDFADITFFGFPQRAIVKAVVAGQIDAGTVRTGILEAMIADGTIPADALTILNPLEVPGFDLALSTVLVPEWLIAATQDAPTDLSRHVALALLALSPEGPAGTTWLAPQSLASVIAVQRALAASAPLPAGRSGFRPVALGLAGLAVLAVLAVLAALAPSPRGSGQRPARYGGFGARRSARIGPASRSHPARGGNPRPRGTGADQQGNRPVAVDLSQDGRIPPP
ncbi:MAG: phosphate/phosphite/phosphonate ABC transporter substrate-binding protein [Marinibacterium sp.]